MRDKLASTLNIDISQINIKATTEEGLGFTGRLEGIAVHAVSLIEKGGL
jgi:2-C-methyl-D-erythritol 2,4-cyclodiphosphate synthase